MRMFRVLCLVLILGVIISLVIFNTVYDQTNGVLEGAAAVGQLNGDGAQYAVAHAAAEGKVKLLVNFGGFIMIATGLVGLLLAGQHTANKYAERAYLYSEPARRGMLLLMFVGLGVLTACGPYKKEKIEEIQPNETAFLVPLEGATQEQDKFQSVEYLESRKVAVKRVTLPQRKLQKGRAWFDYEWIPTARLIRVDRSPVTREWTRETATGTSNSNEAIYVESADSIGFGIGVNITAAVEEPNTAKFLYHYAGKPLDHVIDTNIRGRVASFLSREFGRFPLEQCRSKKVDIFERCEEVIRTEFAELGITIRNLGYAEGMVYADAEIQKAINQTFVVELNKKIAEEERKAQEITNQKDVEMAVAKRQQAEEFAKAAEAQRAMMDLEIRRIQAQALQTAASRWNGNTPTFLFIPGGSSSGQATNFLMQLPPAQ